MRTSDTDFLGEPIAVGDFVIIMAGFNGPTIHKILRFTDKMVCTAHINAKTASAKKGHLGYGRYLVKIPPEKVTYHLIKT